MLADIARNHAEAKASASSRGRSKEASEETAELPGGNAPIEARSEAAPVAQATEETKPPVVEEETLIRIGDKEFKTQAEAIRYAESLEIEKTINQSYSEGMRDAIRAQIPVVNEPVVEDNFEERFYTDPKGTLKEVQAKATQDAIQQIRAEQQKEQMWNTFLSEYPDVRRKDAERVLHENWDSIGAMTDVSKAMKVLAQRVRQDYDEISDLRKPRTVMNMQPAQVVSSGSGHAPSVTLQQKEEAPLDFATELKRLRNRTRT